MLKSPSGRDRTGLAPVTAGNMLQVISNRSLAHATALPGILGPFSRAALPGFALVKGSHGAETFLLGGACVRVH